MADFLRKYGIKTVQGSLQFAWDPDLLEDPQPRVGDKVRLSVSMDELERDYEDMPYHTYVVFENSSIRYISHNNPTLYPPYLLLNSASDNLLPFTYHAL